MRMWRGRLAAISTVIVAVIATPAAQSSEPAFEVASVKHVVNPQMHGFVIEPGGRLRVVGMSATTLIKQVAADRPVVGLPDWADDELFDIVAAPPTGTKASTMQVLAMLRTLLRTRFALRTHPELRDTPVYVLSATGSPSSRTGLKASTTNCDDFRTGLSGQPESNAGGRCAVLAREGGVAGTARYLLAGRSMDRLAADLHRVGLVDRPVVNRTGIDGIFDVEIEFTRAEPRESATAAISVFTAVREQLGMKLEPAAAPIETLVIDSIERPTPD
ncbi:MAG TPA: TIGR03435 family protein [Vicinamibacterales bacterium]|nr:TIGR03435 family protein [Vicinamibacterales bacterium]